MSSTTPCTGSSAAGWRRTPDGRASPTTPWGRAVSSTDSSAKTSTTTIVSTDYLTTYVDSASAPRATGGAPEEAGTSRAAGADGSSLGYQGALADAFPDSEPAICGRPLHLQCGNRLLPERETGASPRTVVARCCARRDAGAS
jgi:hypothetical protein